MLIRIIVAAAALLFATGSATAKPPLEAFGDAPAVRSATISPDGKTIAYITRTNGVDYLAKYDVATGKNEPLASIPDIKSGGVDFVGNNFVVLRVAKLVRDIRVRDKYEETGAFAVNLTTRKIVQLLEGTEGLHPFQTNLGNIVGVDPGGGYVYMPAFMSRTGGDPSLDLLKVNLDTGRGVRVPGRPGTSSTRGWIMDDKANVVARVDFSEKQSLYEILAANPDGGYRVIYSENSADPSLSIVGFSKQDGALVAVKSGNSDFQEMYEISLADGKLTGPLRARANAEIEGIIRTENRTVIGVSYSGLYPSYELFDEQLNRDLKSAISAMPDSAVSLSSWSDDWSRVLLYADGGASPPRYMLFDRAARNLTQVARVRPEIGPGEIGEVITIEYKARDGLTIPALITWPANVPADQRKNLPLIVMPHGGPETYDGVGFDWLAQFLANEGYMVLQPNFRGSGGFGKSFAEAGYGQWGRKMQDDVTDGAKALMTMGWANPGRTCIVGWSYGGYAALAGGALTPDLYKCVVAIAGVSDLKTMLGHERRENGPRSSAFRYWTSVIGDPDKDGEAIEAVSPYRLATNFKAPVLLIHGSDDLVVPQRQSELMEEALKAAGKPVTYLRIGKDDHSLTSGDSRNKALTEVAAFLKTHIGQ